jgi:radical SAM superfamily enzyme YgiQ (UPF0313 family)
MKIGLIAISGVRINNEELMTQMGLTLPGFVERGKVIASLPSLGLLTLAGLTPKAFELKYLEVPDVNALTELPGEFDLVAISSFSAKIKDAYKLADWYRKAGTTVVLGGLHVTVKPVEASQHADSIVIGEGEPIWPQLLNDFKNKQLKLFYNAQQSHFTLADAPMPRFDLLDIEQYNRLTVQTQRGCPFHCEFCAASRLLSPSYKIKPVDKVIEEIHAIKDIWSKPFIEFADDNTFVNKKHSKKLLKALAKENIRWFTESDISVAQDDEMLSLMKDSGCVQVLIGLESTALSGLAGLELNTDWKAKQLDSYMAAIDNIQNHGITVNGCFVLGLDGTGMESFDHIFKFVRDSGLYEVQVTVQTAFPGTCLYERLRQDGRILKEEAWELCTLFDVNFQPQQMSVAEFENGFAKLVQKLYSEEVTRERRARYHKKQIEIRKNRHPQKAPQK